LRKDFAEALPGVRYQAGEFLAISTNLRDYSDAALIIVDLRGEDAGLWLSLVERCVRDAELRLPTKKPIESSMSLRAVA
jgi:hypothetical protein